MALPTALFAMIASFAFATAAVLSSVNAQRGTTRDRNSKGAIAAADAGANIALLRLNRFINSYSPTVRCISPAGLTQSPEANGWCPTTPVETVGNGSFTYSVTAYQKGAPMTVVAKGTAGTVTRRVEVGLITYGENEVFGGEKFIGESGITLKGGVELKTDLGTNGDVILENENGQSAEICGNIRRGVGKDAPDPSKWCADKNKTEGNKTLPDVELPEGIATNNWNCRLAKTWAKGTNCPSASEFDPYIVANGKEKRTSKEPWEASTRTINIGSNSSLTMGGRDYFVCRLDIHGQLIMPATAEVRVFFDTPENCGLSSGAAQLTMGGGAQIVSTAYTSGTNSVVPGFYLVGSPTIETTVQLAGNSGNENQLMIYAPHSNITITGGATWVGMAAGKTLRVNGNATIEADDDIKGPELNWSSLWERTHYIECVGASASPPDASC